jgi:hypothetical protein
MEGHFISRRRLQVVADRGWRDWRVVVVGSPRSRNGRERNSGDGEQNDKPDDVFDFHVAHTLPPPKTVGPPW